MKNGLMWYIETGKSKEERFNDAIEYYFKKIGHKPTVCHVNPDEIPDIKIAEKVGIEFIPDKYILKSCIWLGEDDDNENSKE